MTKYVTPVSDGRLWIMELASGWRVVDASEAPLPVVGQPDECVAIQAPTGDAALRVVAIDDPALVHAPPDWRTITARLATAAGTPPLPWSAHGFTGVHARDSADDVASHVWWLIHGTVAINAYYRAPLEHAGRDEGAVTRMLQTLRLLSDLPY